MSNKLKPKIVFTKESDPEFLDIAVHEVKEAMQNICNSTETLSKKVHSIITICLAVVFAICGFVFTKNSFALIGASIFLLVGMSWCLIKLFWTYSKTRHYHICGDLMKDISGEDAYYHDTQGIKVYLIQIYQNKIEKNAAYNDKAALQIDESIIIAISFTALSIIIYLTLAALGL